MHRIVGPKLIFGLVLIGLCMLLYSQETIVDSVYSDMYLDGDITYWRITDYFEVDTSYSAMIIGDFGIPNYDPPWIEPNSVTLSYISFDLQNVPDGYAVDSVSIRLYQYLCSGNSTFDDFPVWDIAGGVTVICLLNHID